MPAPWRTYIVLAPPDGDYGAPRIMLQTGSGVEALMEAQRVGGWVEGDDMTVVWPQGPHDGQRAWDWASMRRWGQQ